MQRGHLDVARKVGRQRSHHRLFAVHQERRLDIGNPVVPIGQLPLVGMCGEADYCVNLGANGDLFAEEID